ncbi:MAG: AbrB/MazE/SpoVT family DNA-binding domain-containing protein [Alphaproteobacteria bacterium]|nr:AbrB/MazE/SpoVT family DNA-binding domain-containing protein [Alphaproteobacteria bacterium]
MEVTLTTKGQITLPKALRDSLHLKTGDKIIFEMLEEGGYRLRPKTLDVRVLKRRMKYKGPAATLEDMDQAIMKNAGE